MATSAVGELFQCEMETPEGMSPFTSSTRKDMDAVISPSGEMEMMANILFEMRPPRDDEAASGLRCWPANCAPAQSCGWSDLAWNRSRVPGHPCNIDYAKDKVLNDNEGVCLLVSVPSLGGYEVVYHDKVREEFGVLEVLEDAEGCEGELEDMSSRIEQDCNANYPVHETRRIVMAVEGSYMTKGCGLVMSDAPEYHESKAGGTHQNDEQDHPKTNLAAETQNVDMIMESSSGSQEIGAGQEGVNSVGHTEDSLVPAEKRAATDYGGDFGKGERSSDSGLEVEDACLMQRKRGRSPTPIRRRRQREERERQRERQQRRHSWTVNAEHTQACTETASRRPLRAPWHRPTRELPRPVRPTTSALASSSREVPPRPPVQMGNNTIWWSEVTGLNDPMNDSSTVLPDSTVDMIASNIREMTVAHRTHMLAELIPFVAAFLSEVLAVAAGISQAENDVVEVPVEEEDDAVLMQQPGLIRAGEGCDEAVLMQMQYDPAIPFGSRLAQLQAQLNGMSDGQSAQVAVHLQTMIGRLRRLAGELSRQHRDRFERLEALIATYVDECEGAPLSLQVWGENQLQALLPYLGGGAGRTPPTGNGTAGRDKNAESGAASSADVVVVENSSGVVAETDVPEYRVRRTPGGEWEPATEQEMAEFRAHDRALREEALQQARMDEDNYQRMEAANSQRWDDWAIQSEMDSTPRPSRKRIRVLMTVGDAAGRQLGEAQVESTMDAGSQPVVSFQVTETLLGTATDPSIEVGPAAVARHADPKLAPFDPECMPGLSDGLKAFMETKEARYWLQQFVDGMVSEEMIGSRFGTEVLELFQMWLAIQEDMDVQVRNCADAVKHVADTALEDEGEGSNATTVAAGDGHCAGASDRPGYVEPAKEHVAGMDSSSSHDEQGEDETRGEGSSESR